MKAYEVSWSETIRRDVLVSVEAESPEEAADIAINGYKGRYGRNRFEWPDITELDREIIDLAIPKVMQVDE